MPVPACGSRRAREGASSEAEMSPRARRNPLEAGLSPRARRSPLEGGLSPRGRRNPFEGGVCPRARWNLLEGGVCPRARRNLLEGPFDWATPAGRGGHRNVGRALCVRLSERCVLFLFFAGFKHDSPGFLGDPQGCPRQDGRSSSGDLPSLSSLWMASRCEWLSLLRMAAPPGL
jgi:hypothetical protein